MPEHKCDRPDCHLTYTQRENAAPDVARPETENEYVAVSLPKQVLRDLVTCWETGGDEEMRERAVPFIRDLFDGFDGTLNGLATVDLA